MRTITEEQADAVYHILVKECGHRFADRDSFVWHVTRGCAEFRFIGALGFGGKFRNNGNRDNTPHVDCYPEDENRERLAMIESANKRLDKLFNQQPTQEKP